MDKETALTFLRQHQPMPPDNQLTEEFIQEYDEIRQYFISHPDPECIPLFLNSFGDGSGFGVYQLVEDAINIYSPDQVVPHLIEALRSNYPSVRYWCAQIAEYFPVPELVDPLQELLFSRDRDIRSAAASALEGITDRRVDALLQQALKFEADPDLYVQLTEEIARRNEIKS
jgi:hypothetical protein